MRLKNKTAIVTGGSRGIGKAIAEQFCQEGASVTVADVRKEAGEALVHELNKKGHKAIFTLTDVSTSGSVQDMVRQTEASLGNIDILVNNAGVLCDDCLAHEVSEEEWLRIINVNLTGAFLCCKYVLPGMKERGKGSIINISSVSGLIATRFNVPYCASKAGLLGITRSIAYDYAQYGVRSNAICPGVCETDMMEEYYATLSPEDLTERKSRFMRMQPLGRMGLPSDIASASLFLASDESCFVTGIALPVDGGFTTQ